jgi:arylsulfatase A-like enzyme
VKRGISSAVASVVLAAVLAAIPPQAAAQSDERPNILIVVGDDYGWPFYGFMIDRLRQLDRDGVIGQKGGFGFCPGEPSTCTGGVPCPTPTSLCSAPCPSPGADYDASCQLDISTPNLDRLAMEGVAFENAYATEAACQPAHESIFTGLNQRDLAAASIVGCDYEPTLINHGPQTIPEALGEPDDADSSKALDRGYNTFLAGRWWMGNVMQSFNDPASDNDATIGEQKSITSIKNFIARQSYGTPWLAVWTPLSPHYSYYQPGDAPGEGSHPLGFQGDYDNTEVKNPPHISSMFSPGATRDNFESISYYDERIGEILEFLELLEARDCELGADDLADVHRPAEAYNGVRVDDADVDATEDRVKKNVTCRDPEDDGPCPTSTAVACPERTTAISCVPNPNWDPYGLEPSDGPKCYGTGFPEPTPLPSAGRYKGFRTNTLILYVMDNGAGLQNSKAHFSENGLRTPIIANYPRKIPPHGLHDALVGSIDLFPTILDFVNTTAYPAPPRPFPDARSFRSLVEDPDDEEVPWRRYFFQNATTDLSGQIAVIDSVEAQPASPQPTPTITELSLPSRFKLYTDGYVKRTSSVKRVTHLDGDPFEELLPIATPAFLQNATYQSPNSPAGVTVRQHLQDKLCEWDSCLDRDDATDDGTAELDDILYMLSDLQCDKTLAVPSPTPGATPHLRCQKCADEGGCVIPSSHWTVDCD